MLIFPRELKPTINNFFFFFEDNISFFFSSFSLSFFNFLKKRKICILEERAIKRECKSLSGTVRKQFQDETINIANRRIEQLLTPQKRVRLPRIYVAFHDNV